MGCSHERYGCRNNEYFCLICGEVIPADRLFPARERENLEQEPTKKPATKRSRKGEGK